MAICSIDGAFVLKFLLYSEEVYLHPICMLQP